MVECDVSSVPADSKLMSLPSVGAARLRERLSGDVVARGEAGWDAARQAWNLAADLTFDERRPMRDAFAPEAIDRLEAIAEANDPDGLLVANHVAD